MKQSHATLDRMLRTQFAAGAAPASLRRVALTVGVLALGGVVAHLVLGQHLADDAELVPRWAPILAELFSIMVMAMLCGVVWNAFSEQRSGNILILGCTAPAIGLLDMARMLSHTGMPPFVTPSGPAKAINFWLAARLLTALVLLTVALRRPAPFSVTRARYLLLGGGLALTALVYWQALFHPGWLPVTWVPGAGLTAFKLGAESVIIAIMAAAALLLYRRTVGKGDAEAARYFGIAAVGILSELCFTAYASLTDVYSVVGHLLKIVFHVMLYRAAFVACVRQPFELLQVEVGERRRAEQALVQLNLTLEQRVARRTMQLELANKELESFSYSVSHDLRTPLRAIEGFSQVLDKQYAAALDARGREYLGRVLRASQRMGELIDDILHLSRVSRHDIRRSRIDLTQMAKEIAAGLAQSAPARRVEFTIAPGMTVDADPRLIRLVLENLLGNAWKFTGKRSDARIEVGPAAGGDGAPAIFVRDNGAGFCMEYAHKLFGPFQRLHAASEFDGSGIGLATVQRIVGKHGGRAWAEGAEDQGATFYFSCGGAASEHTGHHAEEIDHPAGRG